MNKRKGLPLIDSDGSGNEGNSSDSSVDVLLKRSGSSTDSDKPRNAPSPPDSETSDSDLDWDAPKKKKKLQTKSGHNKSHGKRSSERSQSNSEPEEGELSDSSKLSHNYSSDSEMEFDDGFDADLIGDEEDRERLERMTEKEREQEIFNRLEKREVLKARFDIEKKLRLAKKVEKRKQEGKSSTVKSKEKKSAHHSISDRKKAMEENKMGMKYKFAELKAKRDKKLLQEKEKLEAERKRKKAKETQDSDSASESKPNKKLKLSEVFSSGESDNESDEKSRRSSREASSSSSSSSSESDSDGESEMDKHKGLEENIEGSSIYSSIVTSDRAKRKRQTCSDKDTSDSDGSVINKVRSEEIARLKEKTKHINTLEDLEKIRLSRHKLENFVALPLFLKTVVGCYVKIGIGMNSGKSVYRVAEIIEVVETGKVYSLGNNKTNKGFKLRHGNQDRVFRLEFISNSKFTQSEFNKWIETCARQNVALPTIEHIEKKQKDITDMICYRFSNEDIDKMVQEKKRFNNYPTNYAVAKTALLKEREMAVQKADDETVNRINSQISEMEEKANAIYKKRTSTIASISYINERNRKSNVERAERAILAEVEERKGMKNEDPFTRRSTRPTKMSVAEKKEDTQMTSALLKQLEDERKEKELLALKEQEEEFLRKKSDAEKKKIDQRKDDVSHDPFAAHNFEIKIDIDATQTTTAAPMAPRPTPVPVSTNTTPNSAPRRSLKFEEYKKIKGLI